MDDQVATLLEPLNLRPFEWLRWREPRPLADGTFETPYHHTLVELYDEETGSARAVCPMELDDGIDLNAMCWRPMPWAIEGGGRHKDFPQDSLKSVVEGSDGYLFLRDNGAFEQIFEATGLSDDNLDRWIDVLDERRKWCEARGISYRILIVPEKHCVYADKLPGCPLPSPRRPICRILGRADEQLRPLILYPLELLKAGRAKYETAFRTDVHWTRYGAYLSYRALMATLSQCSPERTVEEHNLTERRSQFLGDTGRRIDADLETVTWTDPPQVPGLIAVVKGTTFRRGQVDVFEVPERGLHRAVMFRTSNSTHLFPLLMWHFSRLAAVATDRFFYDLVESEKPDVVISEMPERYIVGRTIVFTNEPISVPDDLSTQSFYEVTGHELPLPGSPLS